MLPIPVPDPFRIIAHRGASAYAPENSHAAFALTTRMGVTEIELDTQLNLPLMAKLPSATIRPWSATGMGHGWWSRCLRKS